MCCAANFGHLKILKWLPQVLSSDSEWTCELEVVENTVKNPRADAKLLEWLRETCPLESQLTHADAIRIQCESGNLDVGRFLRQHNYAFRKDSVDTAAAFAHVAVVKLLHELSTFMCTTKAMDDAAGNGALDVVRFLHENRSEGCIVKAVEEVARGGHLDG